uniref:MADS-box domain-containing protein n=1 Tax=Salix viminalis TaxID=40686 RepID=A0A6N2L1Q3_SALVM
MEGKKTRGRQKVEMKRIEKEDDRLVTFSKRRAGIYKKLSELVALTGAETACLVFSPGGKPFSYGHPSFENVLDRFLENPPSTDGGADELGGAIQESEDRRASTELEDGKEKGNKLKDKMEGNEGEDWWNSPAEELNLQELIELEKKFESLQTMLHNKIKDSNNGASSSHAPEIGQPHAYDPNFAFDHGSDWGAGSSGF